MWAIYSKLTGNCLRFSTVTNEGPSSVELYDDRSMSLVFLYTKSDVVDKLVEDGQVTDGGVTYYIMDFSRMKHNIWKVLVQ